MNKELQELLDALLATERSPKQCAMVVVHAYKLGCNHGAIAAMGEIAKTLGSVPNKRPANESDTVQQ